MASYYILKEKNARQIQRKLTAEQQEEACALVASGVSLRQAARQLGISRSALHRVLKNGQ